VYRARLRRERVERARARSLLTRLLGEEPRPALAGLIVTSTPDEVRRVVPPDESDATDALALRREGPLHRGPRPPDAQRRVLLVDDEPVTLGVVTAMLQQAGYSVMAGKDGHSALSQLYNAPPDLLLTDLNMPGMDGASLMRRLRGDLALSRIPVLLMTSEASSDASAHALGADGFLSKPVDQDLLLGLVRTAIVKSVLARSVATTPGAEPIPGTLTASSATAC
jgi:CheY-like chemotaxis protein